MMTSAAYALCAAFAGCEAAIVIEAPFGATFSSIAEVDNPLVTPVGSQFRLSRPHAFPTPDVGVTFFRRGRGRFHLELWADTVFRTAFRPSAATSRYDISLESGRFARTLTGRPTSLPNTPDILTWVLHLKFPRHVTFGSVNRSTNRTPDRFRRSAAN